MSCPVEITHKAMDRLLDVAHGAASAALAFYGRCTSVNVKADASPVTEADRAAHAAIERDLTAWDPTIPIVSEEGAIPPYTERRHWRRFWLVDPLDGTKEFIAGNGEFTVNISLVEDGEPVLGVIVAPAMDVAYCAGRGLGAWRIASGDERTSLPFVQEPSACVRVVESRSHPTPRLESFIASLGPAERIPLGSSLKFCRVAEGTADVYARFGRTMEWDVAAGDCIVRNARPDRGIVCARYNQPTLSIPEFVIGSKDQKIKRSKDQKDLRIFMMSIL